MALIEELKWRHAVKAYDPTRKVSDEDIDKILEATRLTPTSSGLQPFRMVVVKDQVLKERIAEGTFNPDCARDCSHILVFASWDNYTAERIDSMYDYTTDERGLPRGRFNSYTTMLKNVYLNAPEEKNFEHIARQAYIGLGLALAQAAELHIDSTPIEGFRPELVDEVLELKKHGLRSVLLMYVGYADAEKDWMAPMKKVRVPADEFVIRF